MVNEKVFPKLEQAIEEVGEAGCRLAEMNACDGTSGYISRFIWDTRQIQAAYLPKKNRSN
jgi:hypothetical protein